MKWTNWKTSLWRRSAIHEIGDNGTSGPPFRRPRRTRTSMNGTPTPTKAQVCRCASSPVQNELVGTDDNWDSRRSMNWSGTGASIASACLGLLPTLPAAYADSRRPDAVRAWRVTGTESVEHADLDTALPTGPWRSANTGFAPIDQMLPTSQAAYQTGGGNLRCSRPPWPVNTLMAAIAPPAPTDIAATARQASAGPLGATRLQQLRPRADFARRVWSSSGAAADISGVSLGSRLVANETFNDSGVGGRDLLLLGRWPRTQPTPHRCLPMALRPVRLFAWICGFPFPFTLKGP